MSELTESTAGGTMRDGTISAPTAGHPQIPAPAGSMLARAWQHPGAALVGVIALAIVEAAGAMRDGSMEQEMEARIAQIEADKEAKAQADAVADSAKKCAEALTAPDGTTFKLAAEHEAHANEQLEFQAEIANRVDVGLGDFATKLGVDLTAPTPLYEEYKNKGAARGAARRFK